MAKNKTPKTVSDLIPDNKNFNKGNEFGESLIEKSFSKFGAGRSILIDKNNRIIAGNKSTQKFAEGGGEKIVVIETDGNTLVAVKRTDIDLDTPEGRELALADNATAKANIVFDAELIEAEVGEAVCEEWGIETSTELEAEEDDFDVPEGGIETDIVLGDLFEIGQHRLLCGDSTDSDQVAKLMNGQKADMVFTDPPYGISHSGKGIKGATKENDFGEILGDNDVNVAIGAFNLCQNEFPDATLIFWGANYYCSTLPDGFGWLVWDKEKEGETFSGAELAFVNKGVRLDVFRHRWHGMIKASEMGEKRLHPTQKPIALVNWSFKNYDAGKNILDLFLGSGTTMVASHQLNRKCYGMELDPKYCQVIVDRMRKLDPTLVIKRNGQPYEAK